MWRLACSALSWLALLVFIGCERDPPRRPFPNPRTVVSDVQMLNGLSVVIEGQRCRLLGLREVADEAVRGEARDYVRSWLEESGNDLAVLNDGTPVWSPDGAALIWLVRYDERMSSLNVDLAARGLAEPDYSGLQRYTFTVMDKEGKRTFDWQAEISKAASIAPKR